MLIADFDSILLFFFTVELEGDEELINMDISHTSAYTTLHYAYLIHVITALPL